MQRVSKNDGVQSIKIQYFCIVMQFEVVFNMGGRGTRRKGGIKYGENVNARGDFEGMEESS